MSNGHIQEEGPKQGQAGSGDSGRSRSPRVLGLRIKKEKLTQTPGPGHVLNNMGVVPQYCLFIDT